MREHIISEIRRLAAENGGQAPGSQSFERATGIPAAKWRGRYWARWGDALVEAGFEANQWSSRSDAGELIAGVITACRHYGRYPTTSEMEMLRRSDRSVPASNVLKNNIGRRSELVAALAKHIGDNPDYADIRAMLPKVTSARSPAPKGAKPVDGHVYLIKSGDFYKIGRSDELERRVKEIRVALPDAATLIHAVTTDDRSHPAKAAGYQVWCDMSSLEGADGCPSLRSTLT